MNKYEVYLKGGKVVIVEAPDVFTDDKFIIFCSYFDEETEIMGTIIARFVIQNICGYVKTS